MYLLTEKGWSKIPGKELQNFLLKLSSMYKIIYES